MWCLEVLELVFEDEGESVVIFYSVYWLVCLEEDLEVELVFDWSCEYEEGFLDCLVYLDFVVESD